MTKPNCISIAVLPATPFLVITPYLFPFIPTAALSFHQIKNSRGRESLLFIFMLGKREFVCLHRMDCESLL